MRVTSEQPTSAHRALRGARVLHGDTTEVAMAVGSVGTGNPGMTHFAFCPAWVKRGRVVQHASHAEHQQPIEGEVVFDNAEQIADVVQGREGIVVMKGLVHANGCVRFHIDPASIRVIPVGRHEACLLRCQDGQQLLKRTLESVAV